MKVFMHSTAYLIAAGTIMSLAVLPVHADKVLAHSKSLDMYFTVVGDPWCGKDVKMRIETDSPENFSADGYAPIIQKLGYVLGNECAEAERTQITGMTAGNVVWVGIANKSNGWEPVEEADSSTAISDDIQYNGNVLAIPSVAGAVTNEAAMTDTQGIGETFNTSSKVLDKSAASLCKGLAGVCATLLSSTANAWWKEMLRQWSSNQMARRSFEMLFTNPGAIASDSERLRLFEEMLADKEFSESLAKNINSEVLSSKDIALPKLDAKAIGTIASDVALALIVDLAIEASANALEKNGYVERAYWVRTITKPSIDISTMSAGLAAGTITVAGASFAAGGVWAKNLYSFALLGKHLNEDEAKGLDVETKLAELAAQNASIIESLKFGETRGVLYEGVAPRKLSEKEAGYLQDMLISNNDAQIALLKQKAMQDQFIFVKKNAQKFAAFLASLSIPAEYSGLEHANSTPSIPVSESGVAIAPIVVSEKTDNAVEGTTNDKSNGGWVFSYPLFETKKLSIFGREGCYIYAPYAKPTGVRWSGRCEHDRPVGEGRILWMENDRVDWLSDVGEEHGLVFRDGKLHVYADLSGSTVRYTCKNHENIFKNAVVHVPDGTKRELFRNDWLAGAIAGRIIETLVTQCPEVKPSWSTIEPHKYGDALVKIRIPGVMEQYDKGIIEGRSQGMTFSWRNYQNLAVKDVKKDIADENERIRSEVARKKKAEQQLADAQRREADARRREAQRLAVAAEKDRIEKLRLAAEEQWKKRWRMQLEAEVPLENITDLMRFDRPTTIAELSNGRHIILTYRSRNVEFAQGKAMLSDYQRGTDIYEGIPEGGFSWEGWFDAMSAAQKGSFTVVCRLDADTLVGLTEGSGHVFYAQLHSVTDSNYMAQVVLDCARAK